MKKYDTYKDTNVEWIGEIPESWGVIKLEYALSCLESGSREPGGGKIETGIFSLGGEHVGWNGEIFITPPKYISENYFNKLNSGRIKEKDILLVKDGATIGKIAVAETIPFGKSAVNEHVFIIRSNNKFYYKFLFFLLHSNLGQEQISLNIKGSAQPGLNSQFVKSLYITSPTLREQTQISSYLDNKTSLIDKLINNNKKLIKLLEEKRTALINKVITKGLDPNVKMKDSGVEWIGEIPEHWDTSRIKRVADIFGRIGFRGYTTQDIVPEGEGAITLSPSNIKSTKILLDSCTYLSWEKYKESPEIIIFKDDIIFVKTGSTIGKVAMVEIYPQEMTINPQLIVLKNLQMDRKYLYYNMVSMLFQYQVKREIRGGSTPAINQEKINNLKVIQPTISEQIEISSYLDNKTSLIDISMKRIKDENNLLKEYRQSLISNVVTGKMKVVNL